MKKNLTISLALSMAFTTCSYQNVTAVVQMTYDQQEAINQLEKAKELMEEAAKSTSEVAAKFLREEANKLREDASAVEGVENFETGKFLNQEIEANSEVVGTKIAAAEEAKKALEESEITGGAGEAAVTKSAPWYRRWFGNARTYAADKARRIKEFAVRHKKPLIIGGVLTAAGLAAFYNRKELRSAFDAAKAEGFSGSYKLFAQTVAKSMPNTTTVANLIAGTWGAVGKGAGYINALRGYVSNVAGAVSAVTGLSKFYSGKPVEPSDEGRDEVESLEQSRPAASGEAYDTEGEKERIGRDTVESLEQWRPAASGEAYEAPTSTPDSSSTWSDYAADASSF